MEERLLKVTRPTPMMEPPPEGRRHPVVVEPLVQRGIQELGREIGSAMKTGASDPEEIARIVLQEFDVWAEEAERPAAAVGPTSTRLVLALNRWSPGAGPTPGSPG